MDYTGTENLLRLLMIEKNLSPGLRDAINEKATKFLDDLTNDVGRFLCSREGLVDEKQSEDDIRTLVQCVPTALSKDEGGNLPVFNALYLGCISRIPMLIEEGMKHNVGGEGMRGGLLSEDPEDGESLLLKMISWNSNDNWDVCCLDAIKRLREMGFIEKEDINKYNLLWESCKICKESNSKRFNYFADWDPSELKVQRDGKSLLHLCAIFMSWDISEFQLTLSATLRHYPHELGLLLLKNAEGHTPFQVAREQLGEQGSWKMIKKCLDESNGGSVILERDPETNMYPFLSAAVGDDTSELDLVYYFVRRNPLTLLSEHCNDNTTTSSTDMLCSQKRKK